MSSSIVHRGCLHYIDGNRLYASEGNRILTGDASSELRVLACLPIKGKSRVAVMFRPLARLLREHIYHIVPFRDRIVVFGFSHIWCLDATAGIPLGPAIPIVGSRPLTVCAAPNGLYYGEYRANAERSSIRVFFSENGLGWRAVHELKGVRHIHGVYYDEFGDCLWLTTGDRDEESAIWRTTDQFETLEPVLSGSQQTRAITLLFKRDGIFFGSDTPEEQNFLYRLDRESGKLGKLVGVEGSVFHGTKIGEHLVFSTAVEPSEANPSIDAVLYASADGNEWKELARHQKDRWPMVYFQYGQLPLPGGQNSTGRCWYSTFAVRPENAILTESCLA